MTATSIPRRPVNLPALTIVVLALTGCATAPSSSMSPIGRWEDAGNQEAYLVLSDDGEVLGSDGCNGIGGSWQLIDDVVILGETHITLMACQDGDDYWLGGMANATVQGDTLTVVDESGAEIGELQRAPDTP